MLKIINFSNILKQEKDSIIHSSNFNDDANIDKIDDYYII